MAKDAGEVALGFKANLCGDVGQWRSRLLAKLLRALYPLPHEVLVRRGAGARLEQLGEVILAHANGLGQFGNRNFVAEILANVSEHSLQSPRWQSSDCLDGCEARTQISVHHLLTRSSSKACSASTKTFMPSV